MGKRVQSPSSINTFKQCPRKYYYQYIKRLPTADSIHTVRGTIVHSALEDFYDIDPQQLLKSDMQTSLLAHGLEQFQKHWTDNKEKLSNLNLPESDIEHYQKESQMMIVNWITQFSQKLQSHAKEPNELPTIFDQLKPIREREYISQTHDVRGFIDAIEKFQNKIRLMDYKTSKKSHISDAYYLQLAIYALLYKELHGEMPHEVGIYFLKTSEQIIPVTDKLVAMAKKEVMDVHDKTESNSIGDYPMKPSPLCKWSTGQCDFYVHCFGQKRLTDY